MLYDTEQKVLAELERIGGEIGPREGGNTARCPDNREPYVTVAWSREGSCIKKEGHPALLFPTREAAWALWMAAFREYARERKGSISWRKSPTLCEVQGDTWEDKEFKGYQVYGRLHINKDEGDGKA